MTAKTTPDAQKLLREEREMGAAIERLEAEQRDLESPAPALTWEEIQAGAMKDLEGRERRRGILPRLIAAAKIRRLEIRRERQEAEIGPLREAREEARTRLEEAQAKRQEAQELETRAQVEHGDARMRLRYAQGFLDETERELRALKGGSPGG
jgi:chromosome segregation ATPase